MYSLQLKMVIFLSFVIILFCNLFSEDNALERKSENTTLLNEEPDWQDENYNPPPLPDSHLVNSNERKETRQLNEKKRQCAFHEIEYWPEEKLKLNGDSNDCLFFSPESAKCIITVGYYNSALSLLKQPKAIPETEVKKIILTKLLIDYYRKCQAISTGFDSSKDIEQKIKKFTKQNKITNELISYGPTIRDSKLLAEAYNKYYEVYFKAKSWRNVELLGSSDSVYIDSAYTILKTDTGSVKRNFLPTIKTVDTLLSNQLTEAIDTTEKNIFTKPIKTSFGFFTVRVTDTVKRNEITYNDAIQQVRLLAARDYYRNTDSLLTEKAISYYKKNKELLSNQDTFDLSAYLLPPQLLDTTKKESLTSHSNGLYITSDSLPEEVRLELVREYLKKKDSTLIGPISSVYGIWFFKVNRVRKDNAYQSFYSLKSKLLKKVSIDEDDKENIPENHKEKFNNEHAMGILYNLNLKNQIITADKNRLVQMAYNIGLQISDIDLADEKNLYILRDRLINESKRKEQETVEQWLHLIN